MSDLRLSVSLDGNPSSTHLQTLQGGYYTHIQENCVNRFSLESGHYLRKGMRSCVWADVEPLRESAHQYTWTAGTHDSGGEVCLHSICCCTVPLLGEIAAAYRCP